MRNKKGQLGNLQGIIVTLIIVGLLLGVGFFILDEFLTFTDNNVVTVLNEQPAFINETGYTVDDAGVPGFNLFAVTTAINLTDGSTIALSDITAAADSGIVTNATTTTFVNVSLNYSYQRGTSSFEGVNDTISAMLTIPELLGLIILIAMIGIILAVVFNVIPGARVSGA